MVQKLFKSEEEGLIPGLPDDVSLQCLARISHGFEGKLQCVSKKWRDAFRGEDIGQIRAREGLCGDWLFVHTFTPSVGGWQAYDPMADCWHPLPRAPGFSPHSGHVGFCCVVLNCRLLVLGVRHGPWQEDFSYDHSIGRGSSNRVLCFDPFFRKWTELPGMTEPHYLFTCAAIDGHVLVVDSLTTSAEIFDLEKNKWEVLPKLPVHLHPCEAITLNRQFQVVGHAVGRFPRHFILDSNEWKVAPQTLELPSLECTMMTEMNGRLYGIIKEGLVVFDENTRGWRIHGELPYLGMPGGDEWIQYSRGLVGLKGRLYFVGRTGLEYEACGPRFVNFSTVQYCDPSLGAPVHWQDAPRLLSGSGSVSICAALQQE